MIEFLKLVLVFPMVLFFCKLVEFAAHTMPVWFTVAVLFGIVFTIAWVAAAEGSDE